MSTPEDEQDEGRFEEWFDHQEQMSLEPELGEPDEDEVDNNEIV